MREFTLVYCMLQWPSRAVQDRVSAWYMGRCRCLCKGGVTMEWKTQPSLERRGSQENSELYHSYQNLLRS